MNGKENDNNTTTVPLQSSVFQDDGSNVDEYKPKSDENKWNVSEKQSRSSKIKHKNKRKKKKATFMNGLSNGDNNNCFIADEFVNECQWMLVVTPVHFALDVCQTSVVSHKYTNVYDS